MPELATIAGFAKDADALRLTLATQNDWVGVWIGSTIGMVAADALAIVVGAVMGRRLPEKVIRYGAAAAFFLFAIILIVEGARMV